MTCVEQQPQPDTETTEELAPTVEQEQLPCPAVPKLRPKSEQLKNCMMFILKDDIIRSHQIH